MTPEHRCGANVLDKYVFTTGRGVTSGPGNEFPDVGQVADGNERDVARLDLQLFVEKFDRQVAFRLGWSEIAGRRCPSRRRSR